MTRQTGPVIVELNCEANPSTDTVEIDRAEWDAMTPAERGKMLNDMAEDHIGNSGGYGWNIADPDDEAAVGFPETPKTVDVDAVMTLVAAYGAECRENGPRTGRAADLLAGIRQAITGKEE